MTIKLNLLSFLFIASIFTILSCKKDDEPARPQGNCQLAKAIYFDDNGDPGDSLEYTFTADLITKMSNTEDYGILEYDNNKRVIKRIFFEAGNPNPNAYDIFTYNTDAGIRMIKSYSEAGGQIILYNQYEFYYSNGKLTKFDKKEYDYNTGKLNC
jgi:hypothetical protein